MNKKVRKSFAEFERTGRVNKTIAKYLDRDALELLAETQRLCRKLDRGKLTDAELCQFIDRLVPAAKQQIDITLKGPGGLRRSFTVEV